MADKPLSGLPLLTSAELTADMLVYLAIPVGTDQYDSRATTLGDLKTFVNTDPTVVPSSVPWRGCRVRLTSDDTGVVTDSAISWDAASPNTDSIWAIGTPTRLTVPAGVTKVRLIWGLDYEPLSVVGSVNGYLRKNGSSLAAPDAAARPNWRSGTTGFTTNTHMGISGAISVTAGDYFELVTSFSMAGQDQIIANTRTFLELEVLEASV